MKWIDIEGSVEVDVSQDEFETKFINWLESNGWSFAGVTKEQIQPMLGYTMQQLFVKGEVTSCVFLNEENAYHCSVNITNDGRFVCQKLFIEVADHEHLEQKFYSFLESDEFQSILRGY